MAALSTPFVGIGAAIGGGSLYAFVGFAILFDAFAYWFSDRIALRSSRARAVTEAEAPDLYAQVRELCARAELPMPRLYVIAAEQPNAFATGRNPANSAVAVTDGLLHNLPSDQVRGVIAHELAHVKNRDILVSSVAAMIAAASTGVAHFQFSFLFGGDEDENPAGLLGSLATIFLAPLAATLLQVGVSRQREYLADATAARFLGQGRPLADALETLQRGVQATPLPVNPATASLYIVNPLRGDGLAALSSTHPPLQERGRRLRALDGERVVRVAA